jgi:DNA-binding CsgD family transcriptional regulator
VSHFKIKDLSKRWATVVKMAYAGKSSREIAEVVGMTARHIRREVSRLHFTQDFEDAPPNRHEDFGPA